jgi:hypothetical protein
MVHCEELDNLVAEISKLTGEFQGWEGELKMTPKSDPLVLRSLRR